MKLQGKILLILAPLIVIPIATIGWLAYRQLNETEYNNRINEIDLVVDQLADKFDALVETSKSNIALFSSSFLVEKYALTTDENERYGLLQRPLIRLLSSYQRAFPVYNEIRFILPDGYESARVASDETPNKTEDEIDDSFIKELLNGGHGIRALLRRSPDTDELSLYTGNPIYIRDDSIDPLRSPELLRGAFVITAGLEQIYSAINNARFGSGGFVVLVDEKGNSYSSNALNISSSSLQDVLHDEKRKEIIESDTGLLLEQEGVYLRSSEIFSGFHLIAVLPVNELEAAARSLGYRIAVITTATILMFYGILWFSLRYLVINPITILSKAAQKIGHGHMDVRINLEGKDEIGHLANSFVNMAKNLSDSHSQVEYLAHHDALTGLPNRRMFKEYINRSLAYAKRNHKSLGLMFIDIDEFKHINDTMGHEAGDKLLEEISDRLSNVLRTEDFLVESLHDERDRPGEMVARIGGDEFTLLLNDIAHPEDASKVAERILKTLADPFVIERQKFFIGGSIGITFFPQDGETTEELLKNADLAMYQAKKSGKNTYRFFTAEMNEMAMQRVRMESKIRRAIEKDEFVLFYQPLVDMRNGEIIGLEALIRWRDGETGQMIQPNDFIPLAEETGLIVPIGEWVIREACRQIKSWLAMGYKGIMVSVNASSVHLSDQSLPEFLGKVLAETGIPYGLLEVELTETSVMSAAQQAADTFNKLHDIGVSVALDDFGTGYSSLSYLREFSIDKLKIDRSFVKDIESVDAQRSIITAIIGMAHTLGLTVVAEGIETPEQLSFLKANQCDIAQGFLLSRPKPADEIEKLLFLDAPFEEHFVKVS